VQGETLVRKCPTARGGERGRERESVCLCVCVCVCVGACDSECDQVQRKPSTLTMSG
jgi:hypothetical protein